MEQRTIKVINKSNNKLPEYSTLFSAGMDLRSNTECIIKPMERKLIPTGLYMAIPDGYEAQVRPRSGLAIKKGITVVNTPGCVDADYRGEVGVILINLGTEDFKVELGDRIAQLIISPVVQGTWFEVKELDSTERTGGFGHSGIK